MLSPFHFDMFTTFLPEKSDEGEKRGGYEISCEKNLVELE
jgi:hypothetical protein